MTQQAPPLIEETVPLKSRLWVSGADAGVALLQAVIGGGTLNYYFVTVRGMDVGLANIVWILFAIWNSINDPLFGYISDRTRSKIGRRIPYIRYGVPLFVLGFIIFWINFNTSDQMVLFAQFLLGLFIYDSLYTAIATSLYIMPFEMAVSNKARSSIFIWKIVFTVITTALPLIVLPIIKDNPSFGLFMGGLGIVVGAIVYASTFFYREKQYLQEEQALPFLKSFVECFKNRSFIIFEVLSFMIIYVQASLMQGTLYYFGDLEINGTPMYIALFTGVIAGVLVFIRKREAWGVRRCLEIWCASFALACLILLLFGTNFVLATFAFFFVGVGFAGGLYLIPLMNGDVIDMDEHLTGKRREGMYAGVNSFITKPAISLANAAFNTILGLYNYNQLKPVLDSLKLEGGDRSAIQAAITPGILQSWVLIPAILLIVSFIALRWYPLAGQKWNEIKHQLSSLHDAKEKEYLEKLGFKYIK